MTPDFILHYVSPAEDQTPAPDGREPEGALDAHHVDAGEIRIEKPINLYRYTEADLAADNQVLRAMELIRGWNIHKHLLKN